LFLDEVSGFGGAVGDIGGVEGDSGDGLGEFGVGLVGSGALAGERGDRGAAGVGPGRRLAGDAVEDEEVAGLGEAGDGIDAFTVADDGDEVRRGADVEVPDVVADVLEMPEALARESVEGEDAVAEEIVADAIDADHVGARAPRAM